MPSGWLARVAPSSGFATIAAVDSRGTQRLEAFSDGVFAIAATLLVLEFAVNRHHGAPPLGYQLVHQLWPSYLAYATSFLTIAIIWINHHHVMETIDRVDRTFLFITALLLLVVAFLSPIASVALTFAIAAFYLPSAALFDRVTD